VVASVQHCWLCSMHVTWRDFVQSCSRVFSGGAYAEKCWWQLPVSALETGLYICRYGMRKKRMKQLSERRKHCALAAVRRSQKISPRRRPLPGGARRPKFNQLDMITNQVWWESMHAISSYCGNRPTNKQTHPQTHKHTQAHRQDRLQYAAPQLASVQCNNEIFGSRKL